MLPGFEAALRTRALQGSPDPAHLTYTATLTGGGTASGTFQMNKQ